MGRQELDTTEQLSFPSSLLLVQPVQLALMFGPGDTGDIWGHFQLHL